MDPSGEVHLLRPVKLNKPAKAVVMLLPEDEDEPALLSGLNLAESWNPLEEDEASLHLQPKT